MNEINIKNAVKSGEIELVERYLSKGINQECLNSLIWVAAYSDQATSEMLAVLMDAGANPNYRAPYTYQEKVSYNPSLLSSSSRDGKFNIVKLLLDAGADEKELEWDELKHKIAYGSLEECKKAIQIGCSLQSIDGWDRTPFLLCILSGDINKAQLLLENGASLNDRGRCEMTCLMYAVHKNDVEMCKWLISKGANVNEVTDFGTTALIEAAEYGASDCVKVLLEAGANLHAETVTQGCAIENAINIETVQILVNAGADINRIGGDGNNLLMYAVEKGNYQFLKELLENGADPNVTSIGEIPLHKASRWGNVAMVKLLLEYGSNPNAKDVDNETPLHWVKSAEIAKMLMEAGAKYDIINIVGQTALDYAEDEEVKAVILSSNKNRDRS